ncbi:MAG: hypothetical protein Q9221_004263 [Calogaya cf. arnoldii]
MCLPYLIEIKPTPRKNRMHRTRGQPPRSEASPPPCIITIEPRSPKVTQKDCSPRLGGLHIHGEASLRGKREQHDTKQSQPEQPRSHHPSPRSPPHKSPTCEAQKSSKGSSSSSSSSSSSTSSSGSLQELQHKIETLVQRLANMEKEMQADRERGIQTLSTTIARDNKIEKEIGGLKDAVGGINKEMEVLRKDVVWVKEQRGGSWDRPQRYGDGGGREGRVRVEWERVRRSPREESRSPRQGSR